MLSAPAAEAHLLAWARDDVNSGHLGLRCESIVPGRVVMVMDSSALAPNDDGSVGAAHLLAATEHCMGLTAATALAGSRPALDSFNAEFFGPAHGPLTFQVQVTKRAPHVLRLNADVLDAEGNLCMRCTGSVLGVEAPAEKGAAGDDVSAGSPA